MIKELIEQFQNNKNKLRSDIKTLISDRDSISDLSYEKLLELIIKNCFQDIPYEEISYKDIVSIDFGDYQGTLIFVFHEDRYQPSASETYYTSLYYGSCSGCDTLLAIKYNDINYDDNDNPIITDQVLDDLMNICLYMVENINRFKEKEW